MALQVLAFLRTQPPDKLGLMPLLHMLAVVSAASAITNYAPCEALWVLLQCWVATSNGTDLLHVCRCTCLPFACRLPFPCRQRPQYLPTAGRSEVSSAPHGMACVLAVFLCTVLQLTTHHTSQTVQGCAATCYVMAPYIVARSFQPCCGVRCPRAPLPHPIYVPAPPPPSIHPPPDQAELQLARRLCEGASIVVADEAHTIKNPASKTNRAMGKIRTRARLALTGYPLQNNLEEYYCMIHWVGG